MHELLVFSRDCLSVLPLPADTSLHGFRIVSRKGKVIIAKAGHVLHLEKEGRLEQTTFLIRQKKQIYAYRPEEPLHFGRELMKEKELSVSREQFLIENGVLKDPGSANGTYVNKKRSTFHVLQDGDEITAGPLTLYWFRKMLLSTHPLFLSAYTGEEESPAEEVGKLPAITWQPVRFSLEKARLPLPYQPPSLFASTGSSLMILLSTLMAAGATSVLFPERKDALLSTLVTSVSMAGAFLCHGLISRRLEKKKCIKSFQNAFKEYQEYLAGLLAEKKEQEDLLSSLQEKVLAAFQNLAGCSSPLAGARVPCGFAGIHCTEVKMPSVGYEQKKEEWSISMQQTARQLALPFSMLFCLEPSCRYAAVVKEPAGWLEQFLIRILACSVTCCIQDDLPIPAWAKAHPCVEIVKEQENLPVCTLLICSPFWKANVQKETGILLLAGSREEIPEGYLELKPVDWKVKDWKILRQTWHAGSGQCSPWLLMYRAAETGYTPLSFYVLVQDGLQRIDLRENGNGPHLLCAGTTGSGKSEFLASMLLQLCLFQSSDEFQFLLIDFKGGALAQSFQSFPHFAGSLSNLNAYDMDRFEMAMEYELEKRQRAIAEMLKEYPQSNGHIDAFNEHFPEKKMPHLLIVFDEFAQLKSRMPASMNYIKELARIGRSLGIHLALCTQKPSGIVDEQIWANSQLRICMKVQSVQDSREVVGHEKASQIAAPGQGYMDSSTLPDQFFFTALYPKESFSPAGCWRAEKEGVQIAAENTICSAQEYFSGKIAGGHAGRTILPPFYQAEDHKSLLCIDVPWKGTIAFYETVQDMPLLFLYDQKKEVLDLLSACRLPVLSLGLQDKEFHPVEMADLYRLAYLTEPCILFWQPQERAEMKQLGYLFENKKLNLVIVSRFADLLMSLDGCRLASRNARKEEFQYFTSHFSRQIPEGCFYFADNEKATIARILERKQQKEVQLPCSGQIPAGLQMETYQAVYLPETRRVYVCFDSQYSKEQAFSLLRYWKKRGLADQIGTDFQSSRICFLDLSVCDRLTLNELGKQLESAVMLYTGSSFSEYAFSLGLKVPFASGWKALWIQDRTVSMLERIITQ